MSANLNSVILAGNLTRDPELRYVPSGQAVTAFSISINRTYLADGGEKKESVTFIRIVAWGKLAEACNEYLAKGSSVLVSGRLDSRSWDAPDGGKRHTVEVIANLVQFLTKKDGSKPAKAGTAV